AAVERVAPVARTTSTPPRGQGWASIRWRMASAPAIPPPPRPGLLRPGAPRGGGLRDAGERARGAGRVDATVPRLLHRRGLAPRPGAGGGGRGRPAAAGAPAR